MNLEGSSADELMRRTRHVSSSFSSVASRPATPSVDAFLKKKKRRTYVARKEEMAELLDEMKTLRGRLALLKATPPEQRATLRHHWTQVEGQQRAQKALVERAALNFAMQSAIRDQQLHLAGSQSLMSSLLMNRTSTEPEVPFARSIRLPADHSERKQILRGMREASIKDATQFMLARRQFLDLRRASHQAEEFDLINGDFKSLQWDVAPFYGAHTVSDVYDELLFFMMNQEMSATEHLNAITLRESNDDDFFDVAQVRLVTTMADGVGNVPLTIERNLVIYMQAFAQSALLDEPHALMVVQAVDSDELYPYSSRDRLRQDITAVVFITAAPTSVRSDRPCISMTRWAAVHMHNGEYVAGQQARTTSSAGEAVDEDWRDEFDTVVKRSVHEWCDLMLTTMKECMRMRRIAHRRHFRSEAS